MTAAAIILLDGDEQHKRHPETFWMPPLAERQALREGDLVKLVFMGEPVPERMWVRVMMRDPEGNYYGTLDSQPVGLDFIEYGDEVHFAACNVIAIHEARGTEQ
jgi:uncharacterized protein YegJ (DUF2314 family)